MIRAAILAAAIALSTPAQADDVTATQGLIHVSMILIACGINLPAEANREFEGLALKYGLDRMEFAQAIARVADQNTRSLTSAQKDTYCAEAIRTYRRLGFLN